MERTLLPLFKGVSVIFAVSAIGTGIHALVDPVGFSNFFGMPLASLIVDDTKATRSSTATIRNDQNSVARDYISLMGIRQLATGVILLIFAYQGKWTEMATVLCTIGILVAGTDGVYLSRSGAKGLGRLHAIPGALIAALAGLLIYSEL